MMETTFIAALTRSLHQHGEKTALTFVRDSLPGEGIAFGRLNRYVNCFAHSLLEMGVAKGDRVILAMDKCPALLLAHLAIMKIGAISVPLNPGFKKPEMEYFLDDSGAGLVISDAERSKLIHALNLDVENMVMDTSVSLDVLPFFAGDQEGEPDAEVSAEDPALIIYTSGTTGKPKGAVLSHANLLNDAETINQVWEISATDTIAMPCRCFMCMVSVLHFIRPCWPGRMWSCWINSKQVRSSRLCPESKGNLPAPYSWRFLPCTRG